MSRSGYTEYFDGGQEEIWAHIRWRGQVTSAIRGKRGQQFFRDLVAALDAMPDKRLIAGELEQDGCVCAIGSVGKMRGVDMSGLDPDDAETVADTFDIAHQLAREVVWENDEGGWWKETPERRWSRMRAWAERQITARTTSQETDHAE